MLTGNLKPTVDEKHLLHCSSYAVKCLTFFQKWGEIFETRVRSVVARANSRRAPMNVYTVTHFTASVEKSACCAAGVVGQSEQETPSVLYYTVFRVSSLIRRRASALLPT
jgi:hypothetical protein